MQIQTRASVQEPLPRSTAGIVSAQRRAKWINATARELRHYEVALTPARMAVHHRHYEKGALSTNLATRRGYLGKQRLPHLTSPCSPPAAALQSNADSLHVFRLFYFSSAARFVADMVGCWAGRERLTWHKCPLASKQSCSRVRRRSRCPGARRCTCRNSAST